MEYAAIALFAFSACVTPGPNNTLIMTSGLNYGIRRSLPHYFGIVMGFPVMVLAVGMGIAQLFERYPQLHIILKLAGTAYLSYLAWRIASAPVSGLSETKGKPFSFIQAAAFQWVNPKAWVLAVGATVTYTALGDGYFLQVAVLAFIFLLVGSPGVLLWLWFGASLKNLLQNPVAIRSFNISMAVLLMVSLIPIFLELYAEFIS